MSATKHFIAGEWRDAEGATMTDVNPATGKPVAEMSVGTAHEIDVAVAAARAALDGPWGSMPGAARRKLMLALASLISGDAHELAQRTTADMGMPVTFAFGEAFFAADWLEYYAGWADKIEGETIPVPAPDVLDYTRREPVGVVGAIVPWNAPVTLAIWKIAPALAAGNAIVIKPSELAPLPLLRLAELAAQAGFPPGVFNLVTGDGSTTGHALVEHPGVDKITFTGGTATGRTVAETCGRLLKRVSLELGGKSANIVFADADLDAAAAQAVVAGFINTGQHCICGSRLLVQRSIHDDFVTRVAKAAAAWTIGDPMRPDVQLGPLVSEPALTRVLGYVDEAREGAEVVAGGGRIGGDLADGFFVEPTIVTGVRNDMRIAREEIFGPVVSVIPFEDADEAIRIANDTPYGLAGGVWTNDLNKAHGVASRIKAGTIWVNAWLGLSPGAPFGGFKASGMGREGGKEALAQFTETKNVYVQIHR